jgi:hypothetical protein
MFSPRLQAILDGLPPDDRAEVERAVRAAAVLLLERKQTVAEVIATLTEQQAPRESAAAARQSLRQQMLVEYWRLLPKLGRSTATRVARKFARDRLDPTEVRNLATALRRWVAEEKRTVCVC